jgi:hypothetical protein
MDNHLEREDVWNNPGHCLAANFSLEVVALDGDEDLSQCPGSHYVVHEFNS